jgi:hypothetical protein
MDRTELAGAVDGWRADLRETEAIWDYLVGRGIEPDYIEKYLLGYVPDGYYGHSISIPLLDGMGRLRSVRFRRLGDRHPKYETMRGDQPHMFNVSSLRHPLVYIAEGEFDAIVLEQLGRKAVGVPGINNFLPQWRWLFLGNHVRLVFDSDENTVANDNVQRSRYRIKNWLEPLAESFDDVRLPAGHDVSSLYVTDKRQLIDILEDADEHPQ